MSSEETGSESEKEEVDGKVFIVRPLPWRSEKVNEVMASLDRKVARRRSVRATEMCRKRATGCPSCRCPPQTAPSWALK